MQVTVPREIVEIKRVTDDDDDEQIEEQDEESAVNENFPKIELGIKH